MLRKLSSVSAQKAQRENFIGAVMIAARCRDDIAKAGGILRLYNLFPNRFKRTIPLMNGLLKELDEMTPDYTRTVSAVKALPPERTNDGKTSGSLQDFDRESIIFAPCGGIAGMAKNVDAVKAMTIELQKTIAEEAGRTGCDPLSRSPWHNDPKNKVYLAIDALIAAPLIYHWAWATSNNVHEISKGPGLYAVACACALVVAGAVHWVHVFRPHEKIISKTVGTITECLERLQKNLGVISAIKKGEDIC